MPCCQILYIAPDENGGGGNVPGKYFFLISPQKHRLWVLIRSALLNTHIICFNCKIRKILTLVLLNQICPDFANSVDPDQLDSEEAN